MLRKIINKIKSERNPKNPFWRIIAFAKDVLWDVGLRIQYPYYEFYKRRILRTNSVECDPESDLEIHILVCKRDFFNFLWSIKTFSYFSKLTFDLIIHEDGTLKESHIAILEKHCSKAKIIRYREASYQIDAHLSNHKYCRKLRFHKDFFRQGIKIFDFPFYSKREKIMGLDPDVMFFRRPIELINFIRNKQHFVLGNGFSAYELSENEIKKLYKINVMPALNYGLYHAPIDALNRLNFIESLLEIYLKNGSDFNKYTGQTIFALLLSSSPGKNKHLILSSDYCVFQNFCKDSEYTAFYSSNLIKKTCVHFSCNGYWHGFEKCGLPLLKNENFILDFNRQMLNSKADIHPKDSSITIATSVDNNYAAPLAVMLRSLCENLKSHRRVQCYVLYKEIDANLKIKIENSICSDKIELNWVKVDDDRMTDLKVTQHVTEAAFYRLIISDVLEKFVSKVIYLDCDMIINEDIGKLWDIEMEDEYVLAVPEVAKNARYVSSPEGLKLYKELGLNPKNKVFNTGVMVINLRKWRDNNVVSCLIDYMRANKEHILWWDQDVLNAVLANNWGQLDPRWNLLSQIFDYGIWDKILFGLKKYTKLVMEPYIIHFNTGLKPWHKDNTHPYRNLFHHYQRMIDFKMTDKKSKHKAK